jgi:hypothetical protein
VDGLRLLVPASEHLGWQQAVPSDARYDKPSPFLGERLKQLGTQAGQSQAELAEKIDSDATPRHPGEHGLGYRLADLAHPGQR